MNNKIIDDAKAAAEALDLAYNQADFPTQIQLKPSRDAAFEAVDAAERTLIGSQLAFTPANISEMAGIRGEIEKAADTQSLIVGAEKLVAFLAKNVPIA